MELNELVFDIAESLVGIDSSGIPFRQFKPGVGPYGEPQLLKLIASSLNQISKYQNLVGTKRNPDLLIPRMWAVEFKITRPFGDNGKEAENWSVNLLHPYEGNVSSISDCIKLLKFPGSERKAVVVIGYEHNPAKIDLTPLIRSFEVITEHVAKIHLSDRIEYSRAGLIHPVHQSLRVFAWEVLGFMKAT